MKLTYEDKIQIYILRKQGDALVACGGFSYGDVLGAGEG